jgi:RHS repeat-associated protein
VRVRSFVLVVAFVCSFSLPVSSQSQPAPVITGLTATSAGPGSVIGVLGSNLSPPRDPYGNLLGTLTVTMSGRPLTVRDSSAGALMVEIPGDAITGGDIVVSVNGVTSNSILFSLLPNSPGIQRITVSYRASDCSFWPPQRPVATENYTLVGTRISQTQTATLLWDSNLRIVCPAGFSFGDPVFTLREVSVGSIDTSYPGSIAVGWEIQSGYNQSTTIPGWWHANTLTADSGPHSGSYLLRGLANYYLPSVRLKVYAGILGGLGAATFPTGGPYLIGTLVMEQDGLDPVDLGECCAEAVGHPINVATGNVYLPQTDFSFPGLSGGLELHRTWNSLFESTVSFTEGWFGSSWWSTFDEILVNSSTGGDRLYYRSDGSVWTFEYDNLSQGYHLSKPADERASLTYDAASGLFTILFKDGSRREFFASVTRPYGGVVNLAYDPFGRRIRKGPYTYLYDGADLIQELKAENASTVRFTFGPGIDEPLAVRRTNGPVAYYQADGLGSITSLTDSAGAVVQTYAYDSFGNETSATGPIIQPFRYTGREWDPEIAMYYYRARYYDPRVGRFVSEDPIQFTAGNNFFEYSYNNPVSFSDPSGLQVPAAASQSARLLPGLFPFGFGGGEVYTDPWGRPYTTGILPTLPLQPPPAPKPPAPPANWDQATPSTAVDNSRLEIFAKLWIRKNRAAASDSASCQDWSDGDDDCDKEWNEARKMCNDLLASPNPPRGITGGYKDVKNCARGLVSQRCGGNRVH